MAYCAIYNIHFQRVHVNYARERNVVIGKKRFNFNPHSQFMPSLARRQKSFYLWLSRKELWGRKLVGHTEPPFPH